MRIIKKLDIYILKNFITLFAGTFCISLFAVVMQFLWKFVDDLVGKGLGVTVIAKFFFYATETLVPLALPLAILLASLISFGNMGERFELLAIKAAGISLWRTMRPLLVLMFALAGASFYFQDVITPEAENQVLLFRYSITQKSPELDIPEGVFYNGISGINLYVKQKDPDTGMLYDVVIYNLRDGVDNAHIILADSAHLKTSDDKLSLELQLFSGEQFENMRSGALIAKNVPYRRETFIRKYLLIDFDTNLNMVDANTFSGSAKTKRMEQLTSDIDSLKADADSIGRSYGQDMRNSTLYVFQPADGRTNAERYASSSLDVDTLFAHLPANCARSPGQSAPAAGRCRLQGCNHEGTRYRHTHAPDTFLAEVYAGIHMPRLLLHRSTTRRHHPQGRTGTARGGGCGHIHCILHHQHRRREDGKGRHPSCLAR